MLELNAGGHTDSPHQIVIVGGGFGGLYCAQSFRRTPGREKASGTAEHGYLHCGPAGAGHFVKMVHNGIEYGVMATYAERPNILHHANAGEPQRTASPTGATS
jgi:6-phosphogluconate dehydrogenase (decarboxylating)